MDSNATTQPILHALVGQKVTVYSGEQCSDTGMLDSYDASFVRLRTDKGTYLYFSIARIRLIKPA